MHLLSTLGIGLAIASAALAAPVPSITKEPGAPNVALSAKDVLDASINKEVDHTGDPTVSRFVLFSSSLTESFLARRQSAKPRLRYGSLY